MRTPRKNQDAVAPAPPATARGRRAHAGPPADEPDPGTPHATATATAVPAADTADQWQRTGRPERPEPPTEPEQPEGTEDTAGGPAPAPAPAVVRDRPGRRGLRPRTVRAKIVSLLMVPVVSLLVLWGFATVTTAQDMARIRQLQRVDADIRQPVAATLAALQEERRAAVRQAAAPGAGRAAELKDRIRRTDEAAARLRLGDGHTVGDAGDLPPDVADRVGAFAREVQGLVRLRADTVAGRADGDRAYDAYTTAVSAGLAVGGALSGLQDAGQGSHARVLLDIARAGEMLSREDALLAPAHLTGRLTADRQRAFTGAAETRRTLLASAGPDLPPAGRAAWARLADGDAHARLTEAEDRISAAADGRPAVRAVPSADWDAALTAVRTGLTAVESDARAASADTGPFAGGLLSPSGAAVVLGLLAVAASLVISVRIGRGLVVELVTLRNTALGIARRKLPAAMGRLRAGEEIDVQAEAPPGPTPQDEIGQVGEALTTVHRAALSAAVERAELASGISGVFVNLARRSQVLVHRQLNLLDSMERRADDPAELGDLFRLDHLTTRMRRHAESLIILSGAAPGRAWRMPVPLTDVVRAAVSEIEDYARVEVRGLPETAVAGGAVADLTHLLAELIENAAQFSPPHTKVRVSGEPVGNGYALEIEDRGLGMGKETLAEANARIDRSEALDLFDSDRLGLFVVSRLSSRHGVRVHLRTSPYGGTTAVVLLPTDLLQEAPETGPGAAPARAGAADTVTAPETAAGGVGGPVGGIGGPVERRGGPAGGTGGLAGGNGGLAGGIGGSAVERAAREHEEAHRAEARRFARPPAPPRTPASAGAAPKTLPGTPPAAPAPAPAPVPAGVTTLRPRGHAVPPRPVPAPRPEPAHEHGSGAADGEGGDDGGLPRRIRQASLAPQLREAPAPAPAPVTAVPGAQERTPEEVRDRMAAYRDGWQRGGGPAPGTRRPLGEGATPATPPPGHARGRTTRPHDDAPPAGPPPAGTGHDGPPHAGTGHDASAHAGTGHGTPPHAGTGHGTPPHAGTGHATPPHAGTGHGGPSDPSWRRVPDDPRSDARARTDLGPYFGARPTPPQDHRPEGDDA
ncbi:nitrate- and nitrite sensing domain-containing protein [Streptomyces filamentosus]|uniref:sensor histidine kinase n=1 Tax=Streptomyces filamentosus TaxID=67294 RepID=UPI0036E7B676